ncbi:DUF3427 domain-containing protein [Frigidibacter sp. ROC022]|uniref:DUF3427 domain-containing protein n=1 Tax=Frigidibacter sp. ROC022 TaxID=2971796 RepID=UPI00215A53FA|nr:DUF3427 domain-containing protein [Frigidibacter sp. ROC022]MCR8725930.1 DUF3427 domain-containing protein [Frigidibacter sp. ROC022]
MGNASKTCPICSGLEAGLIPAPRHVARWDVLTASEQLGLLAQLGEALGRGAPGFTASSEYGHFHLSEALPQGQAPMRLTTGGEDPMLPLLTENLDQAHSVDLAVAFAMDSGVALLEPWFQDLLERGGRLRVVVGDYLDTTDPAALGRLLELEGAELYVFETAGLSFHPKVWLFRAEDNRGAIVGSSNLSQSALTTGVEWNLHTEDTSGEIAEAFEALLARPEVKPLTPEWIDAYAARRRARPLPEFSAKLLEEEGPPPEPHEIQVEALEALRATRQTGHRAGLVILATGLGKTWLAAFDTVQAKAGRILFVAHRDEILTQAMNAFRKVRPDARLGKYNGQEKDAEAEILFGSIQTLGRVAHLRQFAPDHFDYIVVDEFHHAAASTYQKLIDHFTPRFLLGLTATPDRTDGADLLGLCGGNLVYQCGLFDGIDRGHLSSFHYFGVPDEVDYAQIPWRSGQFDPTELEAAMATEARALNAYEQFQKRAKGPAIGFCVSKHHADYMAEFFKARGLRAVAVHSGESSAPRTSSLVALGRGEIDILFAVDMFNEGVDVPEIGTVMMLRPTKSAIIWLQQLGRGLRRVEGKVLQVIDYIGNHRSFLTKAAALLQAGGGDRSISKRLDDLEAGAFKLPAGCEVTYELEAIKFLRDLLKTSDAHDEGEAFYRGHILRRGRRPTALEYAEAGFSPAKTGHGTWFEFVRDMGDEVAPGVFENMGLLRMLERPNLATPEVPALIDVLTSGELLPKSKIASAVGETLQRHGLRQSGTSEEIERAVADLLMSPHVVEAHGVVRFRQPVSQDQAAALRELIAWRLDTSVERVRPSTEFAEPGPGPILWHEYMRQDVPALFGETFNTGSWNQGVVKIPSGLVLFTTLKKGGLSQGGQYEDHFIDDQTMQWQSQTSTRRSSERGRILLGEVEGQEVHLFVRGSKLRGSTAAPFLYLGKPRVIRSRGEAPITIEWQLPAKIPPAFHGAFGLGQ